MSAAAAVTTRPPPDNESGASLRKLRVVLIGNYEHDRQESMQRFAQLLAWQLPQHGVAVTLIRPEPWFGRLRASPVGIGKWLGYFDKFLVFPLQLHRKIAALTKDPAGMPLVVHICDHSNAFYRFATKAPTLITCHDLLAVRGALGEDTDCPASRFGRLLQHTILRGLSLADRVVCDSAATQTDLLNLTDGTMATRSEVILLGQNHPYHRLPESETTQRLAQLPGFNSQVPFLLSVGLNLRRKNRRAILRIFSQIRSQWSGQVVFAGEPLDAEALELARSLGVECQVVQIAKPSNAVLEALYNRAFALFYPSKCEGFGWPIIEAQACGCPVVCSDRTSVPEVAGKGALICALEDETAFAKALLSLQDPLTRQSLIKSGYENLERFRLETMMDRYRQCYSRLAAEHAGVIPVKPS